MGLEAGIWASRLGFGPQDWNLALRLGFEGGGKVEEGEEEGEEGEEGKNPPYV